MNRFLEDLARMRDDPSPLTGVRLYGFPLLHNFWHLLGLSCLTVLLCVPIVTLPAALSAFSRVCFEWVHGGTCTYPLAACWSEFRQDFPKRLLPGLLLTGVCLTYPAAALPFSVNCKNAVILAATAGFLQNLRLLFLTAVPILLCWLLFPDSLPLLPAIGRVFAVSARSYQALGNFYTPDHGWDLDAILGSYGGAAANCAGSHRLDMILHLFSRPERVYANINCYPGTRFDRKSTAIFEYAGERPCSLRPTPIRSGALAASAIPGTRASRSPAPPAGWSLISSCGTTRKTTVYCWCTMTMRRSAARSIALLRRIRSAWS